MTATPRRLRPGERSRELLRAIEADAPSSFDRALFAWVDNPTPETEAAVRTLMRRTGAEADEFLASFRAWAEQEGGRPPRKA